MEHDLVKKTKANLFEKAFKKIQEKNNQFNQTIDNTQRSNSPLQNVSIGSSDTNRPPFEFDVDIKDDGSGTFQGDFSQQINPNLNVGGFYKTNIGDNTENDDYGIKANYGNKLFNLNLNYGAGNKFNANAGFDMKF
tara:strand:+ start:489 stop:896 length:408 start_codon:yes stop_codon:yes gene_type:complete